MIDNNLVQAIIVALGSCFTSQVEIIHLTALLMKT